MLNTIFYVLLVMGYCTGVMYNEGADADYRALRNTRGQRFPIVGVSNGDSPQNVKITRQGRTGLCDGTIGYNTHIWKKILADVFTVEFFTGISFMIIPNDNENALHFQSESPDEIFLLSWLTYDFTDSCLSLRFESPGFSRIITVISTVFEQPTPDNELFLHAQGHAAHAKLMPVEEMDNLLQQTAQLQLNAGVKPRKMDAVLQMEWMKDLFDKGVPFFIHQGLGRGFEIYKALPITMDVEVLQKLVDLTENLQDSWS